MNELRQNAQGRWIDGRGQFVSVKATRNGKSLTAPSQPNAPDGLTAEQLAQALAYLASLGMIDKSKLAVEKPAAPVTQVTQVQDDAEVSDGYITFADGSMVIDTPAGQVVMGTPSEVDDDDDDDESPEHDAYANGYDAGQTDGEDDTVPAIYTVDALARYMGMTVTELHTQVGTSFVDGWLTGFAEVRPQPKRMGIKGIFSRK